MCYAKAMRHLFIINPSAGSGRALKLQVQAEQTMKKVGLEACFARTRGPGHAEELVRAFAESTSPEEGLRIYACGGDGTLNEVVNGIHGYYWAEIACLPCGSGNDFARLFSPSIKKMLDVERQLKGRVRELTFLNYKLSGDKLRQDGVRSAVNIINTGFDSKTVKKMEELKASFRRSGPWTYLLAVFINLLEKQGADLKIFRDGIEVHDGKVLLMAAGKGRYYGGGVKALPCSDLDTDLIDNVFIRDLSRLGIINFYSKYKAGSYIEVDRPDLYSYARSKRIGFESNVEDFVLAIDGELFEAGRAEIWTSREKLRFIVPQA